jgi:hypothetical protein
MRLEIRWPMEEDEWPYEDDGLLDHAVGLHGSDLDELRALLPSDATVTTEASSVGKGASGLAVALVVDIERVVGDAANLIALGAALWGVIRHLRKRRKLVPTVADDATFAALGAAAYADEVVGMKYRGVIPISASPSMGSDFRDIWAVEFSDEVGGSLLLIFMSPTGLCLGTARVPFEAYMDVSGFVHRTPEQIKQWRDEHHA